MNTRWLIAAALVTAACLSASTAGAQEAPLRNRRALQRNNTHYPWHGAYYHVQYGEPLALVVPPTARFQTNYSWGVPATRVSWIKHQFVPNYPFFGGSEGGFLPTPLWPSDTDQFGVYYVRGPW